MDRIEARTKIVELVYDREAPMTANTLTLGCEFEFVLTHSRPLVDKKQYRKDHGKDVILQALSQPRSLSCAGCKSAFEFALEVVSSDENDFNKWQIGYDSIVRPQIEDLLCLGQHRDEFEFYPIEVRSRILRYNETNDRKQQSGQHEHWITFQEEITVVLDLLDERFGLAHEDNIGSQYHILPSSRSGLHVHVGNGVDVPVSFSTAKKVYTTLVACERQLDRLFGTDSISGVKLGTEVPDQPISGADDVWQNMIGRAYNKPPSAYLIAAAHMRRQWEEPSVSGQLHMIMQGVWFLFDKFYPQRISKTLKNFDKVRFGYDFDSWLTLINGAQDTLDCRGLNCLMDKHCTITLRNIPSSRLSEPPENPTEDPLKRLLTIEFRQHAGTLLPIAALSYIDFVVNLVLRCHNLKEDEFEMLMKPGGLLRKPQFTTLELCDFVKCSAETYEFYRNQTAANEDSVLDKQLNLEEANIQKHTAKIPVADYALSEIHKLRDSMKPQAVGALIDEKLLTGGYGQFTAANLDVLLPSGTSAETRQKLTIGYQVPFNYSASASAV